MPANLVLIPAPENPPQRLTGMECGPCSEHYGFRFRPRVTIKPQLAVRLISGAIVIENPTVICASCADRGLETVL